jgi:propionyl-CoA synthetase
MMDETDTVYDIPNKVGKIMIELPCPPGHMDGLWQNDQAYTDKYLSSPAGYYMSGDAGYYDEDGYLYVMTRTDDVINVAGHRISTGRIEEVLSAHEAVAECAVVGREDTLKGEVPIAYIILYKEVDHPKLNKELQKVVRDKIGAFGKLDKIIFV